jgi:hypothetical protein
MDGWREREARRRTGIRERNEWIQVANEQLGSHAEVDGYVCECGAPGCLARVALTVPEYEAVRVGGAQFLVATDHQDPEIEAVVMEDDRFVVVRVLVPSLARIVRESDPRS